MKLSTNNSKPQQLIQLVSLDTLTGQERETTEEVF